MKSEKRRECGVDLPVSIAGLQYFELERVNLQLHSFMPISTKFSSFPTTRIHKIYYMYNNDIIMIFFSMDNKYVFNWYQVAGLNKKK